VKGSFLHLWRIIEKKEKVRNVTNKYAHVPNMISVYRVGGKKKVVFVSAGDNGVSIFIYL